MFDTTDAPKLKVWSCKIGECEPADLPDGADLPMRSAVERAYHEITGKSAAFNFSGWGANLDEVERAVVENRPPAGEAYAAWLRRENADELHALLRRSLEELTQLDGTHVVQLRADIRAALANCSDKAPSDGDSNG